MPLEHRLRPDAGGERESRRGQRIGDTRRSGRAHLVGVIQPARVEGAVPGIKGLSLFVVPAFYARLAPYTRSPEAVKRELEKQEAESPSVGGHA